MWPVHELRVLLPEHLHACEDADFLALRCQRCGWTAWFSAAGATHESVVAEAKQHHCGETPAPHCAEGA